MCTFVTLRRGWQLRRSLRLPLRAESGGRGGESGRPGLTQRRRTPEVALQLRGHASASRNGDMSVFFRNLVKARRRRVGRGTMARARTHPWLDLFPPFFAFTNFDAGDMFESVGLRNLRGERRSVRRGKVSSSGVASSSSATKKKDKSETAAVRVIASSSEFRPSRRASRAYLASRVFFPMDFGYSVGIMLASLCASAVGDSARGICCSGESWDIARRRDRVTFFFGGDEGFRRTRGRHEKRALGWGPGRLAGTPRGSGDAREVKACATEARGTKRSSASGCGEWPASLAAAPSCHERRFFGERDHPRSGEKNVASILPGL